MSHPGERLRMGRWFMTLGLRWLILLAVCFAYGSARADAAETLERRLLAPCCYQQTLDIHASEPASALRHEIRTRLAQGETSAQVEHDLVRRYGERLLAVPTKSPLELMALASFAVISAAALALWWRARRWVRRTDAPETDADDGYDERLRAELNAMDD